MGWVRGLHSAILAIIVMFSTFGIGRLLFLNLRGLAPSTISFGDDYKVAWWLL